MSKTNGDFSNEPVVIPTKPVVVRHNSSSQQIKEAHDYLNEYDEYYLDNEKYIQEENQK